MPADFPKHTKIFDEFWIYQSCISNLSLFCGFPEYDELDDDKALDTAINETGSNKTILTCMI